MVRPTNYSYSSGRDGEVAESFLSNKIQIIIPWNAKALMEYSFLGFPLGYYFPVQGSLIVFVALIFFQNHQQDKIDDEAGV